MMKQFRFEDVGGVRAYSKVLQRRNGGRHGGRWEVVVCRVY